MLLEARHVAQDDPAVKEERMRPLDRLLSSRRAFVHQVAQILEDGPRERLTFRNVGVHGRGFFSSCRCWHSGLLAQKDPPSIAASSNSAHMTTKAAEAGCALRATPCLM